MECLKKPKWMEYSESELEQISIGTYEDEIQTKILQNWDTIAKPLDGMGRFEQLIAQIGAIQRTENVAFDKKAILIFCADNGVVAEGISQSGQEVTAQVARNMAKKITAVGRMANKIAVETIPIDIGMACAVSEDGILDRKIRAGTRNFRIEKAMTIQETIRAISVGIELVFDYKKKGYKVLGMGEMGIGNTTTSSAIAAVLLDCPVEDVTGRGAGLSDAGLQKKKEVIRDAIEKYQLKKQSPIEVLSAVGGLDIAGLTGMCIGGAMYGVPIVLDGVISMVAALLAERIKPGVREFLIPSHKGKEPAINRIAEKLQLFPVIDANLALGEGTGAVMMLSLLDLAMEIYHSRVTFQKSNMEQYTRFTK